MEIGGRRSVAGSFWPSEEQRLLLRASLLSNERGQEAWHMLRQDIDIQRLELGSMVLLPLLYENLHEWQAEEQFLSRLKGVYRYIWYGNQVGIGALAGALRALNDRAIETIVLGPGALVLRHYQRRGVRPFSEAEVLVHPGDVALGAESLAEAGWVRTHRGSSRRHHFERAGSNSPDLCSISSSLSSELEAVNGSSLLQSIWQQSEAMEVQGVRTSALNPTHELLCTLVGGARSGGSPVQWIADAMAILAASEIDWDRLHEESVSWIPRVRDALVYLGEAMDAPVPRTAIDRFDASPSTQRERVAHWISGRGTRLGMLPTTVATHLVATQGQSLPRAMFTLPNYLQEQWGLNSLPELPGAVVRKSASAISTARRRRHTPEP